MNHRRLKVNVDDGVAQNSVNDDHCEYLEHSFSERHAVSAHKRDRERQALASYSSLAQSIFARAIAADRAQTVRTLQLHYSYTAKSIKLTLFGGLRKFSLPTEPAFRPSRYAATTATRLGCTTCVPDTVRCSGLTRARIERMLRNSHHPRSHPKPRRNVLRQQRCYPTSNHVSRVAIVL